MESTRTTTVAVAVRATRSAVTTRRNIFSGKVGSYVSGCGMEGCLVRKVRLVGESRGCKVQLGKQRQDR